MSERITVHKFEIRPDVGIVEMPRGAQLLHVAMQDSANAAFVWALVDTAEPLVKRRIAVVGTGHAAPSPPYGVYVGTFQMLGGSLVWHVFDGGELS